MRTITITVYEYKELSEKAKERARNWYLAGLDFDFEWDDTKQDAKNIGLNLTEWAYAQYIKGEFIVSAKESANKILKEHGEQCETYKTAFKFLQDSFVVDKKYEETGNEEEKEILETEFLHSLLEDYRVIADKQYDYIQSEEAIAEAMEVNQYEFDIDGKRI